MEEGLLLIRDLAVVLLFAAGAGVLFRKFGLSTVVAYLAAGMVVGPNTPPFSLVHDTERIHTLSELGLVFLMFFVGMELSLRRVRQLGVPLLLMTAGTAGAVFWFSQGLAKALGWHGDSGLYLAGMLMVSSSAIITKTLGESGATHERFARRALGMMVLEDIVAVVMLALLATKGAAAHGGEGAPGAAPEEFDLGRMLVLMGGFVAIMVVAGILVVPTFLRRVAKVADVDLRVAAVAGVLLGIAYLAASAGYSVALGSFLLGMVVAETNYRERIEKGFTGVKAMFVVVFFVSVGMMVNLRDVVHHWPLVLLLALFSIAVRAAAATLSQLVTGLPLSSAVRTALVVTPIGEFSYIIAQLGVGAGALPSYFFSVAAGASVISAFLAPFLLGSSERIAAAAERVQPRFLARLQEGYRAALDRAGARLDRSPLWVLTRGRLAQVVLELLLFTGILGFAPMLRRSVGWVVGFVGLGAWMTEVKWVFWPLVLGAALVLGVAIWRNVAALGMIVSQAFFWEKGRKVARVLDLAIQIGSGVVLTALFFGLFPVYVPGGDAGWFAFLAVTAGFLILFRNRLIRWHSRLQFSMTRAFKEEMSRAKLRPGKTMREEDWGVDLVEVTIPEGVPYAGQTLRALGIRKDMGCTVAEIERQGVEIGNPHPDQALYPGDRVLLIGGERQTAAARAFLEKEGKEEAESFRENTLETVLVPEGSPRLGKTLAELRVFTQTGVQILGIRRDGRAFLNPSAREIFKPGDALLVLATPEEGRQFERWLLG